LSLQAGETGSGPKHEKWGGGERRRKTAGSPVVSGPQGGLAIVFRGWARNREWPQEETRERSSPQEFREITEP